MLGAFPTCPGCATRDNRAGTRAVVAFIMAQEEDALELGGEGPLVCKGEHGSAVAQGLGMD